jgi:hypothetical protein
MDSSWRATSAHTPAPANAAATATTEETIAEAMLAVA